MREAEAKLATAQRGYEQVLRDYARNEAICAGRSSGMPALLSLKDLDASRLARDNAQAGDEDRRSSPSSARAWRGKTRRPLSGVPS